MVIEKTGGFCGSVWRGLGDSVVRLGPGYVERLMWCIAASASLPRGAWPRL
jgi:hypothetical protein